MHRYCIVSGILLILPIIDFAVTAPVSVNVVHVPEDAITTLGKRGDELDVLSKVFLIHDDHFAIPEVSSATRPSSSSQQSGFDHGQMDVKQPPSSSKESPVPSRPALLTIPPADYEWVGQHAPLSNPVTLDHGYMGPHAPKPNSDNRLVVEKPPAELAADYGYEMVHPPSASESSLESQGYEMVHPPPSSPVPSKNPNRRSIDADSRVEYLQAIRDASKSKANRVYGTARDVLNE